MKLALGNRRLGDGHLGSNGSWWQALGTGNLADWYITHRPDESSGSGNLLALSISEESSHT